MSRKTTPDVRVTTRLWSGNPLTSSAWRALGPCADPTRWDLWTEQKSGNRRQAIEACRACPVLEACRVYVLHVPQKYAIWAGMTITEQRRERRKHHEAAQQDGQVPA